MWMSHEHVWLPACLLAISILSTTIQYVSLTHLLLMQPEVILIRLAGRQGWIQDFWRGGGANLRQQSVGGDVLPACEAW